MKQSNTTIIELLVEIKNKNKTSEDEAKINIVKEIINKKLNEL